VHKDASNMVSFMKNMDKDILLEKLITYVIEQEQHNIGSQIGFDQNAVDEMIRGYVAEEKATKNNNRRKRRR
jgi:ATP-dependent RNA helicase DeaD